MRTIHHNKAGFPELAQAPGGDGGGNAGETIFAGGHNGCYIVLSTQCPRPSIYGQSRAAPAFFWQRSCCYRFASPVAAPTQDPAAMNLNT